MTDYTRTLEQAQLEAEKKGCHIVLPKPNQLQLDIDDEERMQAFESFLEVCKDILGSFYVQRRPSPSGRPGRYHVTITLLDRTAIGHEERIFLQAVLGSDPMRELLNWRRYKDGDENPSLFFEKDVPAECGAW